MNDELIDDARVVASRGLHASPDKVSFDVSPDKGHRRKDKKRMTTFFYGGKIKTSKSKQKASAQPLAMSSALPYFGAPPSPASLVYSLPSTTSTSSSSLSATSQAGSSTKKYHKGKKGFPVSSKQYEDLPATSPMLQPFRALFDTVRRCPWFHAIRTNEGFYPQIPREPPPGTTVSLAVTDFNVVTNPQFVISCAIEHVHLVPGWIAPDPSRRILLVAGPSGCTRAGLDLRSMLLDGVPSMDLQLHGPRAPAGIEQAVMVDGVYYDRF